MVACLCHINSCKHAIFNLSLTNFVIYVYKREDLFFFCNSCICGVLLYNLLSFLLILFEIVIVDLY